MTYRQNLEKAQFAVRKLKEDKHLDPDVEHVPVQTYQGRDEWKDRYDACTCSKERLDPIDTGIEQAINLLDLIPLIDICLQNDIPVNLSNIEDITEGVVLDNNRLKRVKFIREITNLDLEGAFKIEGELEQSKRK